MLLLRNQTNRVVAKEDVRVRHEGAVRNISQAFVKHGATWKPVFEQLSVARWGYAEYAGPSLSENGYEGPQSFIEQHLTTYTDNSDGQLLTYDLPDNVYAYFAHPASLGVATFTDTANSFQGAWDGATWLDDYSNLDAMGPVEVEFDAGDGVELWYVYRTDWPGPSVQPTTFRIDFPDR